MKFLEIFKFVSKRRKVQLIYLTILMSIGIVAELCAIGALMPFLAIIILPESSQGKYIFELVEMGKSLGLTEDAKLLLTSIFLALIIISGSLRIFLSWSTTKISFAIGVELSAALFESTLSTPYIEYKISNSSNVLSTVTKKSDDVVYGVIYPSLVMVSASAISVAIITLLAIINFKIAIITITVFGAFYLSILFLTRKRLIKNSKTIAEEQSIAINIIQNASGGYRDIILHRLHTVFLNAYTNACGKLKKSQGENIFITTTPRYAFEMLTMVVISVAGYFFTKKGGPAVGEIPTLGAFVLAAQRLLPSAQQIYWALANIKGTHKSIEDVIDQLNKNKQNDKKNSNKNINRINFKQEIELKDIGFKYDSNAKKILNKCNLIINKNEKIGFIGATGSGKSTFLDIVMGLLKAEEGEIIIDGDIINDENRLQYQKIIAHVPQNIFLVDGTVAQNIAFEEREYEIDMQKVMQAAKLAQAEEFINYLPNKYYTRVGERGALLSGGQCQRIGIARAIYRSPELLVLDEATSALDDTTEERLMTDLCNIKDLTILMIAHREKSLKYCNKIYQINDGKISQK